MCVCLCLFIHIHTYTCIHEQTRKYTRIYTYNLVPLYTNYTITSYIYIYISLRCGIPQSIGYRINDYHET